MMTFIYLFLAILGNISLGKTLHSRTQQLHLKSCPLSLSSQFAAILIKMVRTLIFRQNLNLTITAYHMIIYFQKLYGQHCATFFNFVFETSVATCAYI